MSERKLQNNFLGEFVMKKFRLLGVLFSAVMLASCSENAAEQEVTETVSESTVTTSETTAETTAKTTTETTTEETTETEAEEVTQTAEDEYEYVQVSPDNEFIDFEIIEDYQGTTDIGDLADKAVEFLKESEYYAKSMENISEFTDEEFSEYIRDGVIVPKFSIAYPNDYDGDGNTETFIIIKMPYSPPHLRDGLVTVRDFVIFSDKDDNMEIIDETSNMFPVQFLNYGKFKHIAIGGAGMAGVEEHTILYGVRDGRFVRYYGDRCYFAKEDCFLSVFGWQGRRDFMYFDTAAQEYRVIVGVDVSVEDIRAMDTTNVLAELLEYDEKFLDIQLIGGKYYCIVQGYTDWGHVYTYDNGVFTLIEDSNVLISPNLCELKAVVDIDIEQALASMKPVQK